MKTQKVSLLIILFIFFSLSIITATIISQSPMAFQSFVIGLPDTVEVLPGEIIQVNGTILNLGIFWLHQFNLSLSGLPETYDYRFVPNYFTDVRILREWNPQQGVYRVPENFTMFITVPKDASGLYPVEVTGKEHYSWRMVSNSSTFVLKVRSPPNITISDIIVPENVTEKQPFDISFKINNPVSYAINTTISIMIPEDWTAVEKSHVVTLEGGKSKDIIFTITPSNKSGEFSIYVEYPFEKTIMNITKIGPYLTVQPEKIEVPPELVPTKPTGFAAFVEYVKDVARSVRDILKRQSPVVFGFIILIVLLFLWKIWKIVKIYRKRKKPEELKKEIKKEVTTVQPTTSSI